MTSNKGKALVYVKGQIKPEAVWVGRRFSQKTSEFDLFAMKSKRANKENSFVCFLGESTACEFTFAFI